ncbi:MAG: GDSL-type esterase/lipase family protein [Eubacteriales bacterium]
MLVYSSRKKKRNRIILLYIPLMTLIAAVGIIMLSAIGFLNGSTDEQTPPVRMLEKLKPDTDAIDTIDEQAAIDYAEAHKPKPSTDVPVTDNPTHPGPDTPITDGSVTEHILRETDEAADNYFDNTLFIGDSRMVGLSMSCQNLSATFYAAVGLSVNQLNTKKVIKTADGSESVTVFDAIKNNPVDFSRIYIMFGLNELGWSYPSVFIRSVDSTIEQLREIAPDAEICIMAIMPVSESATVSIYKGATANERIREYNSMLLRLAAKLDCWYLDTYNLFADENGNLPESYSADGVHMYLENNKKIIGYIKTHTFAY